VKRRLEDQATNDATERTRRSLGNSCFDGSKFGGGSLSIIGIDDFDFTPLELFSLRLFIPHNQIHFFLMFRVLVQPREITLFLPPLQISIMIEYIYQK